METQETLLVMLPELEVSRVTMRKTGNFDIDLEFGQAWEEKIRHIFEDDGSLEVKTERGMWKKTGNIAIEIRYKGEPSGLSTTDARWWVHVLANEDEIACSLLFSVEYLKGVVKSLMRDGDATLVNGGDNNDAQLVLVPLDKLLTVDTE